MEIFHKNRYNGQVGGCNVSVGRYNKDMIYCQIYAIYGIWKLWSIMHIHFNNLQLNVNDSQEHSPLHNSSEKLWSPFDDIKPNIGDTIEDSCFRQWLQSFQRFHKYFRTKVGIFSRPPRSSQERKCKTECSSRSNEGKTRQRMITMISWECIATATAR